MPRIISIALAAAPIFSAAAAPVTAQIPDEFTNLRVLPEDIDRRALIGYMRGFAIGLGVRCEYCHVGEPGAPLSTFDFASDEKGTKETARIMLQMVEAINGAHLAQLPSRGMPDVSVGCVMCHRGLARPVTLQAEIVAVATANGADSALAHYEGLRERYYGTGSYDFSESTIVDAAMQLAEAGDPEGALVLANHNLTYFSSSVPTFMTLGELHRRLDHREEAIRYFERALEISPENPVAVRRLAELRGN